MTTDPAPLTVTVPGMSDAPAAGDTETASPRSFTQLDVGEALRAAWSYASVRILAVYLLSRLVVLAAMAVAAQLPHHGAYCGPVAPGPGLSGAFHCWDARWYLRAAADGYPTTAADGMFGHAQSTIAFFPLFPALVRAVAWAGLPAALAGVLLATALGGVATLLVAALGRRLRSARAGERAAQLFCFFPGAFVLSWTYSEALALTLAAGCLLMLLRRHWLVAGLLAAAATATRSDMLALVLACAVAAGPALRRREWRALLAPLLAPAGFVGYMTYLALHTGNPLVWTQVQRNGWGQHFDFGQQTFLTLFAAVGRPFTHPKEAVALLTTLLVVAGALAARRVRLPAPLLAYGGAVLVLALGSSAVGPRPRAALLLLPLFLVLAARIRPQFQSVLLACFLAGQALLVIAYLGVPPMGPP